MAEPQLTLDRSKPHSTVHGERAPDDRHYHVHFFQDGIPFDKDGKALPNLIEENDKKSQAAYERKMRRLLARAGQVVEEETTENDSDKDDDDDDNDVDDVNLEAWIRGDTNYPWFAVASAIRKRYAKQVTSAADAVVFLVNEKVVPAGMVAKRFQDALK